MTRFEITVRDINSILRVYPYLRKKLETYFPQDGNLPEAAAAFLSTHANRISPVGQILQALSELDNINVSQGSYLK